MSFFGLAPKRFFSLRMKHQTLNMNRKLLLLLAWLALLPAAAQKADFNVVPLPREITADPNAGAFVINQNTAILDGRTAGEKRNARFLQQYLFERTGFQLPLLKKAKGVPTLSVRTLADAKELGTEGYRIDVDARQITITGADDAGAFYGVQTLRKALPHLDAGQKGKTAVSVPATHVSDAPRFGYRGMELDVARHFVTVDSVKRFIDLLALHNINRFHWHLTDDQGWRIEIKRYPRLTAVGSQRAQTVIGHNTGKYDGRPHGGFYTQQECRDIVRYAAERHITVIPEIDLPGHMVAALAAYPELGCTGGPYQVRQHWGIADDVLCAGNPKTYEFIDNVLDEVTNIFPSTYVHIGGDECPKERWKQCPKCQAFIGEKHLQAEGGHTAEERLQSYVIRHTSEHLAKKGRRIIGWDEILEGGLAPGATVMSWRGEKGGIDAAKSGHDAIMTPNSYLYFDYYQSKNTADEPMAIGGYLPLERVYAYEPVPNGTDEATARRFIGVQANIWTEYIPTFRGVEYMALPRAAALAEIQWRPRGVRNYQEFLGRLPDLFSLYKEQGYNFAKHYYDIRANYDLVPGSGVKVTLSTVNDAAIRYTLDGSEPTMNSARYEGPLLINQPAKFRAVAFRTEPTVVGKIVNRSHTEREDFHFNKATARSIELLQGANAQYKFAGAQTLVDGLRATNTNHQSGRWIGFYTEDMEAVIDLGTETPIEEVGFNVCVEKGSWIYDARRIDVAVSDDGKHWTTVAERDLPALTEANANGIVRHTLTFPRCATRFVKVHAVPEHQIPAWHTGAAGNRAFLFVDEIEVK